MTGPLRGLGLLRGDELMTRSDDRLFLIAGATGKTGTTSVRLLLERGHRVRAFVHRPDERSEALAAAGAEIAAGDLLNFHDVSSAMRGVSGAYFAYPIAPGLLEATVVFAQAAAEAGVRSVVNMSQSQGDHGVLRLPFGTGRHAPVAGVDQSYVIAAILEHPEPHDRQAYPLYGPVEMDHHGIADAVSRALGIPVTYDPISIEQFADTLAARGRSPHLIQHISNVAVDYQDGIFAGTNNLIEVIGNRTLMTVEDFVTSRKDAFQRNGPLYLPAGGY